MLTHYSALQVTRYSTQFLFTLPTYNCCVGQGVESNRDKEQRTTGTRSREQPGQGVESNRDKEQRTTGTRNREQPGVGQQNINQECMTRSVGLGVEDKEQRTRSRGQGQLDKEQRTRIKGQEVKDKEQRTRSVGQKSIGQ